MHFMRNLICDVDESHHNFTVTVFLQFGYDQLFGEITVRIHPLNVPLNENSRDLIVTLTEPNGLLTFKMVFLWLS